MGIFDFIGGGASPEKAVKLKAKVTQKYGDPATRQKAIEQLGQMNLPEAVMSLMARFTLTVEPATTDADEKDHVLSLVTGFGANAVGPVKEFFNKSDQASSWALRILSALLPEPEVIGICVELLERLAREYSRDPEKKNVVIQFLAEKEDPRIAPAVVPFLEDMGDDVKIAALKSLAPRKFEPAREPMLRLLTGEETARRVQTATVAALAESGFGVQGFREKVEARLAEPYFLDKSGVIKKRG